MNVDESDSEEYAITLDVNGRDIRTVYENLKYISRIDIYFAPRSDIELAAEIVQEILDE